MGQTVRNPEPGPPSTLIVVVGGKGGLVCSCGVTGLGQWGRDVLQLAPVPPAPPPPTVNHRGQGCVLRCTHCSETQICKAGPSPLGSGDCNVMMVEMSDGTVQGEPRARRERTLSTKPTPGGQRDGGG